jgi:hypothetical protein
MLLCEYAGSNLVSVMCVINKQMRSESVFKQVAVKVFMIMVTVGTLIAISEYYRQ